jgi:transcriptional regulator with XRE-family HTH domain
MLLREAIGERLRRARTGQRRTLRDVSRAAKVSLGYLSEVERGRKEASSELLAAICAALALPLADLLREVALDLGNGTDTKFDHELERDLDREFDRELDRVIEGGRLARATVGEAKAELRIAPALTHRLDRPISDSPAVNVLPNAGLPNAGLPNAGLPAVTIAGPPGVHRAAVFAA